MYSIESNIWFAVNFNSFAFYLPACHKTHYDAEISHNNDNYKTAVMIRYWTMADFMHNVVSQLASE